MAVIPFFVAKPGQVSPEAASAYFVHCGSMPDWTGEGVATAVVVEAVVVVAELPGAPTQ